MDSYAYVLLFIGLVLGFAALIKVALSSGQDQEGERMEGIALAGFSIFFGLGAIAFAVLHLATILVPG